MDGNAHHLFRPAFPDYRRQNKPQQSANTSASARCNDVDTLAKSSKLSASAPEFVPSGFNPYEVRGMSTPSLICLNLIDYFSGV